MNKLGEFFSLKKEKFVGLFSVKEDKTDLNLLLRQLLNDKTVEQTLQLKSDLDLRYDEIMQEELEKKSREVQLISNHLKNRKCNKKLELEKEY